MKFLELNNNEWINLDLLVSFYTQDPEIDFCEDPDEPFKAHPFGITFNLSGYEESGSWYKTKEERDAMVRKLKHYYGGWL